jgi:hypothetical protein
MSSAMRSVNHGEMPVAAAMPAASAHPCLRSPMIRHSRLSVGARNAEPPGRVFPEPAARARLEGANRLQQRRPELAVDGHRLAGRLHLHAEAAIGERELVERPARQLHDHVVDGRLERGAVATGRRVRQLVEPLAERDEGGDARDRVPGRLRRQRRRAAHPRIHLDHPVVGAVGGDRQLDVAAPLELERADDLQSASAQALDDRIRQGLDRCHDDRVAGMDSHRVHVLHATDRDRRVGGVAQDLELDLVPAEQRALDEDLADGACSKADGDPRPRLLGGHREPASAAAQRESGTDDDRRVQCLDEAHPVLERVDDRAFRHRLPDAQHQVAESPPVLCSADRGQRRPENPDAMLGEHARIVERHRQVEAGLSAEGRQQCIGLVLLDDPGHVLERQRTDDHGAPDIRVRHHRRRIRVHEDRLHALRAQRKAGLDAGVVELGGLADEDRPGADHEDLLRCRHVGAHSSARSKTRDASIGPGAPSGWNWTDAIRPLPCTSPSTVSSFRSRWLIR